MEQLSADLSGVIAAEGRGERRREGAAGHEQGVGEGWRSVEEELGGDEVEEDQTVELGGESSGEDTSPFESEQGQCDNTLWITSNVQARALKFLRKESISS